MAVQPTKMQVTRVRNLQSTSTNPTRPATTTLSLTWSMRSHSTQVTQRTTLTL